MACEISLLEKYIVMNKSVGKPKLGLLKNGQPYIMEDESF